MDVVGPFFAALGIVMREAALFAATGFVILGLGDLLIDLLWIGGRLRTRGAPRLTLGDLPPPRTSGFLAVFVPAWDESAVIGQMLRGAIAAWDGEADWRIYVGCYPNDPATVAAVRAVGDARVRIVSGLLAGPTTKAECLNRLWAALLADEAAEGRLAKAVLLHDAEDVVHPAELRIFHTLSERFDLVQLPVQPLIDPNSRWIGGHYADEFAESHGKEMVVRQALGAGLPSAGVGCAFSRTALARIAAQAGGAPFDADSLTEDYELGLKVRELGGTAAFVRVRLSPLARPVAVREFFPGTMEAAVSQKARWITGIALSGWDRVGWSGGLAERWMRLRDRQSVVAAAFLFAGYGSFLLWVGLKLREGATGVPPPPLSPALAGLLGINAALLAWRLAFRFAFTTRAYGAAEGLRAVPRALVGNYVAIMAAWVALTRYRRIRRTGRTQWHKTAHAFPAELPAE